MQCSAVQCGAATDSSTRRRRPSGGLARLAVKAAAAAQSSHQHSQPLMTARLRGICGLALSRANESRGNGRETSEKRKKKQKRQKTICQKDCASQDLILRPLDGCHSFLPRLLAGEQVKAEGGGRVYSREGGESAKGEQPAAAASVLYPPRARWCIHPPSILP